MGQIRNENVKESPMTRFGGTGTPDNRSRRLRNPSFTAAEWTSNNPLLQLGEIGYETDTHKTKIGDGVTYWTDLPYQFDDVGANTDLDNLTSTGKANISAQGTYDAGATYETGTVGAALQSKADAATSANTSLSNLTSTGANIANWSSNVSNCITEIPQNIAITVSSGSITLKSGSKVYIPNGSDVFTETTIASDLTNTGFGVGAIIITNGSAIFGSSNVSSGTTAPENPVNGTIWYDTTNNIVKRYSTSSSSWVGGFSLPVGIVVSSSEVSLFNGFGYIGSTAFALPGVKGLTPDGRNTDGTLKSRSWTCSSVITRTFASNETFTTAIGFEGTAFGRAAIFNVEYNEKDNVLYLGSNKWNYTLVAQATLTSGVISNFTTVNTEHLLSYNDTEFIGHQAMPSSRYTSLTLPATGNTVTAPADGYIMIKKESGAAGESIIMQNYGNGCIETRYSRTSGEIMGFGLRVSKGDIITVNYTATGTTTYFRLIYANGSK